MTQKSMKVSSGVLQLMSQTTLLYGLSGAFIQDKYGNQEQEPLCDNASLLVASLVFVFQSRAEECCQH